MLWLSLRATLELFARPLLQTVCRLQVRSRFLTRCNACTTGMDIFDRDRNNLRNVRAHRIKQVEVGAFSRSDSHLREGREGRSSVCLLWRDRGEPSYCCRADGAWREDQSDPCLRFGRGTK